MALVFGNPGQPYDSAMELNNYGPSLTDSQARTDLPVKGTRVGQLGACLGRGGRARSAATAADLSAALIRRSGRAHLQSAPATSEALRLSITGANAFSGNMQDAEDS